MLVPANARIIDAKARSVPGIVVPTHAAHFNSGVVPQQNYLLRQRRSASPLCTIVGDFGNRALAELQKAGEIVYCGSSTGTILCGADGDFKTVINPLEDAATPSRA
jgi:hypothetical protein